MIKKTVTSRITLGMSMIFTENALKRLNNSCADPGIFVRGGPEKSSDNVFFVFFFSLWLILQKSNRQFQRNLSFSRLQRGSNIFQGWSNIFQGWSNIFQGWSIFFQGGGSNCLFPIETHITCDFPGVVPTPCAPLWIRTCKLQFCLSYHISR